jgi:N-acetylglucosaminyl-diphospho-decaprenol L-rhamnosyltransferase
MSLSIVTVSYNSRDVLPSFLNAAHTAAAGAEVIVVDNASVDGTPAIVGQHPNVVLVPSETNLGFGRACNLGASKASGQLVAFVNPDVRLESFDVSGLRAERPFGLRAGYLRHRDTGPPRPALHRDPSMLQSWFNEVALRFKPRWMPQLPSGVTAKPGYVSGALFLARRDEFHQLGGFDPRFFLYHEDRDLGRRYRQANLPLAPAPGVIGSHSHGQSSSENMSVMGQAWSLVSAIEYDGIWRGQRAAQHSAGRLLDSLEIAVRAMKPLARGSRAFQRKMNELRSIKQSVLAFERFLPVAADGFYPHASAAITAYVGRPS